MIRRPSLFLVAGAALWLGAGCASVPLDSAIGDFRRGQLEAADTRLAEIPDGPDAVRNLMERGMIRHVRRDYAGSAADIARAIRLEEQLETHSVSKAGASMLVNDSVLAFRGLPCERTLLHVFQARNYLARGLWEGAGVEARNIIQRQEKLDGFSDDAYSRYLAGLCLSLSGDEGSAAFQYQIAASLLQEMILDPATGKFSPASQSVETAPPAANACELVCLVDIDGPAPVGACADLYAGGHCMGSAYVFTDTETLKSRHREKVASRRMAKTVARIAVKESIAAVIAAHNEDLGELVRFLLFAVETPDERSWRTLPRTLAVARVPCPPGLESFEVVFRDYRGNRRITVPGPFLRRDRTYVALCRDYP